MSLALVAVSLPFSSYAKIETLDKIVAVVNEGVITEQQLQEQTDMIKAQITQAQGRLPSDQELRAQILEKLITDEVQIQFAQRTGIYVDDTTLDMMVASVAEQNAMSVSELRTALEAEGINYRQYRDTLKRQQIINSLHQRDVMSQIEVSSQEVDKFLNSPAGASLQNFEYKISHILVSLPESPTVDQIESAKNKADSVLKEIKAGADFAQMAVARSSGQHALSGGDLGYRGLGQLPTIFVDEVIHMDVDEVSTPIRSPSGFHLVKLVDKKQSETSISTIEKTKVRHILIKTNALLSDAEAKFKLEDFVRGIEQGTDFSVLAKTHSDDLGSSNAGGELGWVSGNELVREFKQVMDETEIGQISKPFKSSFGWHILEVQDRKVENNSEAVLRENALNMIRNRKAEEKLETWLRQLRDEAYVKVSGDYEQS